MTKLKLFLILNSLIQLCKKRQSKRVTKIKRKLVFMMSLKTDGIKVIETFNLNC